MGLAAGQARLLSITARLTDNEYRTQRLTNARMNLSSVSENARIDYQDALNQNKFVYVSFNSSGNSEKTDLTPSVLWKYQPTKNQYALVNAGGKILVSPEDAKNFEETDTLAEFLCKYNLSNEFTDEKIQYIKDYAQYEQDHAIWQSQYESWEKEHAQWETERSSAYTSYLEELSEWQVNRAEWENGPEYQEYLLKLQKYEEWNTATIRYSEAMTKGLKNPKTRDFRDGFVMSNWPENWDGNIPGGCYYEAINNPGDNCFYHFLNYMLCYDQYYDRSSEGGENYDRSNIIDYASCNNGKAGTSNLVDKHEVNEGAMRWTLQGKRLDVGDFSGYREPIQSMGIQITNNTGDDIRYCDGNDDYYEQENSITPSINNIIKNALDEGRTPNVLEILMSDYVYNPSADGEEKYNTRKTLKQKIIDIYYILNNRSNLYENDGETRIKVTDLTMRKLLYGFVNGDLTNNKDIPEEPAFADKPIFQFTKEEPVFTEEEPFPPIEPKLYPEDKEKAQWYTNLWYRMNGSKNSQEIITASQEVVNEQYEDTEAKKYLLMEDVDKNKFTAAYEVLPKNLVSSKDWLNNVLSQGIITMEKVGVSKTASDNEFQWSSIIHSNATDIISEEDSNAIALAETKYKQILEEVEAKDKKFQMQLRSLDTEHNAIQTEYNSVKSEVDKNISRSFKTFQG